MKMRASSLFGLLISCALVACGEGGGEAQVAEVSDLIPFPVRPPEGVPVLLGQGFSDYTYYPVEGEPPRNVNSDYYGDDIHAGLDLRVPAGTEVVAVRPGYVTVDSRGSKYHAYVNVDEADEQGRRTGLRWGYAHLAAESIPARVRQAAQDGTVIPAGETLGQVVQWVHGEDFAPDQIDAADGKLFDHLHFSMQRLNASGDRWVALNPRKLLPFEDREAPVIERVFFLPDHGIEAFSGREPVLSGAVDVAIQAHDLMGKARFRLGLYRASLTVLNAAGETVFQSRTPAFDSLPADSMPVLRSAYYRRIFLDYSMVYARGDRFGRLTFLSLTNVRDGAFDSAGAWDTRLVPNGIYRAVMRAEDEAGNAAEVERTVEVRN